MATKVRDIQRSLNDQRRDYPDREPDYRTAVEATRTTRAQRPN